MRRKPASLTLPAVLVVGAVLLGACNGSDDVTASTVTTSTSSGATTTTEATSTSGATTTTSGATTTATATSATATTATSTTLATGLAAALLTPADLPGEFTAAPGDAGDVDEPTLCGTPKAEKTVPSLEQARVELTSSDGQLLIDQDVFRYADEATATSAMPLGLAGLSCLQGSGTADDGTTFEFDLQQVDLPATIADERFAFQGTLTQGSSNLQVMFVAMRDGALINTLTFLALAEADAPNALPIIEAAADRLAQVS